jgi:asparagine synthase (glutamine-hydrolysing)
MPGEGLIRRMVLDEAGPASGGDILQAGPAELGGSPWWTTPDEVGQRQPLADDSGQYLFVGHLRLDNREEIAARLRQAGDSGRGSDSRLFLSAYKHWGSDAFCLAIGDFAAALWDGRLERLVCVRDAIGRRDLVYHQNADRCLVASHVGRLFCDAAVSQELSERAVAEHLLGDQLSPELTFYAQVHRLPPGCYLEIERDGRARLARFWAPREIGVPAGQTPAGCAEQFRERFLEAVRSRLRSRSSSVGLYVSGGFDSTAVAGAVHYWKAKEFPELRPWTLFATARQAGADESSYLREVLQRYPMPLETVAMEDYWAFRPHPLLERFQDEPFEAAYGSRIIAELEIARRMGS